MQRPPIAIIGIGNFLMGDEGVGIHAIERLRGCMWPGDVELIDAGTPGLALLHLIEGRRLVIIIDCAAFGGQPGEIQAFDPRSIVRNERAVAGLHAVDLPSVLDLSQTTGHAPERILIVGIQPKRIAMGTALNKEVEEALGLLPEIIRRAIGISEIAPHPIGLLDT